MGRCEARGQGQLAWRGDAPGVRWMDPMGLMPSSPAQLTDTPDEWNACQNVDIAPHTQSANH